MMTSTSVQSIIETLTEWFASHSIQLSKLEVSEGTGHVLYKASGSFTPCAFDNIRDGLDLELDYHQKLVVTDERFRNTKLRFLTDTKFKIV